MYIYHDPLKVPIKSSDVHCEIAFKTWIQHRLRVLVPHHFGGPTCCCQTEENSGHRNKTLKFGTDCGFYMKSKK